MKKKHTNIGTVSHKETISNADKTKRVHLVVVESNSVDAGTNKHADLICAGIVNKGVKE